MIRAVDGLRCRLQCLSYDLTTVDILWITWAGKKMMCPVVNKFVKRKLKKVIRRKKLKATHRNKLGSSTSKLRNVSMSLFFKSPPSVFGVSLDDDDDDGVDVWMFLFVWMLLFDSDIFDWLLIVVAVVVVAVVRFLLIKQRNTREICPLRYIQFGHFFNLSSIIYW
jgi:hypothetical protein